MDSGHELSSADEVEYVAQLALVLAASVLSSASTSSALIGWAASRLLKSSAPTCVRLGFTTVEG